MAPTVCDIDGSAVNAVHELPIGTEVVVTKRGCLRYADVLVVVRHDRNGTYRVRFPNGTFVTAHADEVRPA